MTIETTTDATTTAADRKISVLHYHHNGWWYAQACDKNGSFRGCMGSEAETLAAAKEMAAKYGVEINAD